MIDIRNRQITKPVDGWRPPDTDELFNINGILRNVCDRIGSLRNAFLINAGREDGRIRRIIASQKAAIKKAYQKGFNAGRKSRRHA